MKISLRSILLLILVLAMAGSLAYALLPQPVPVDLVEVDRGALRVTVDEDGKTRITDRYIVSSPIAGRLERISLDEGDSVLAGETSVARIVPGTPGLLDSRELAQAEARVEAAEAAVKRAETAIEQAKVAVELARSDAQRARKLAQENAISMEDLEEAEGALRSRLEELRSMEFAQRIAQHEQAMAQAALIQGSGEPPGRDPQTRFEIEAPVSGRILQVFQESETVVSPGTPLVEIGDPRNLEIEVDVLSTDAVKIEPGARVLIEHWGGNRPLEARTRLVEPSAFTKVSALGVEEQRVNIIADFIDSVQKRKSLGDGYRVEARIVTWESDDVIRVPTSALFRINDQWAVFVARKGRAEQRLIQVAHRNDEFAEVVKGLEPGEQVVAYPSDRIEDGVLVEPRQVDS